MNSEWNCTIEQTIKEGKDVPCLRIGFRYVRGLRKAAADKIVSERQKRPFEGIDDLVRRVPELQKAELVKLSEIGALLSWKGSASKNCSVASGTRGPACRPVTGCDSRADGIVTTASDDGRRASCCGFSRVGHEHWPASDDVLPGGTVQAASETSVRFASSA